jgi:uncharacterized protein (DUF1778 family)
MKNSKNNLTEQLVVRVPEDLRKFYVKAAKAENRRLSVMLRIALEDQAKQIQQQAV